MKNLEKENELIDPSKKMITKSPKVKRYIFFLIMEV